MMGKGITVSTMLTSIKVMRYFVFVVIRKTPFHLCKQELVPIFSRGKGQGKKTTALSSISGLSRSRSSGRLGSEEGEEMCSRVNEAGNRRFNWH
jgi:hypothetical protein